MAKQSGVGLDINLNADGYDAAGGTTKRKLVVTGADITLAGSGTNVYTFPNFTCNLMGLANAQTSAAGIGNTADTNLDVLFTYSLPANAMSVNGKGVRVTASGHFANNANSKRVTMSFGGTAVADSVAGVRTNTDWMCTIDVVRIDDTHVSCIGRFTDNGVADVVLLTANLNVASLTSNTMTISVLGQSVVAGTANDVLGHMMRTEFLN